MTKYDERPLRISAFWTRRRARFTDEPALSKRRVLSAEVARAPRVDDRFEQVPAELTTAPVEVMGVAIDIASAHDEEDTGSVATLVEHEHEHEHEHEYEHEHEHEHEYEYVPDELPEDTVIMPVIGDRVHYSRGTGHLVGLLGVVVPADDDTALPSGLRYVLFDDEEWPTVVTVTELDRE